MISSPFDRDSKRDMEQKQINNLFVAHWKEMLLRKANGGKNDKQNEPNKGGKTE